MYACVCVRQGRRHFQAAAGVHGRLSQQATGAVPLPYALERILCMYLCMYVRTCTCIVAVRLYVCGMN